MLRASALPMKSMRVVTFLKRWFSKKAGPVGRQSARDGPSDWAALEIRSGVT
jgi:hypothetical protein